MAQDFSMESIAQSFMNAELADNIIVKAEDIELGGGGINFADSFFEPQPNHKYTVKLIMNPFGDHLTHRTAYNKLPDPKRKGKTFNYVSSGDPNACPALTLFFELHKLSKEGDALAQLKISEFLGRKQQGCVLVQILASSETESNLVGQFRLMTFPTFGQNATIANLINEKLNPTKEQIDNGFEKENVFDIFGSATLLIDCVGTKIDGKDSREFTKSSWSKNTKSVIVKFEDDTTHTFSKDDIAGGKWSEAGSKAFARLIEILQDPKINMHNMFEYKVLGDERNTPETETYLKSVNEKMAEIRPIILNGKSIAEIKNYGVGGDATTHDDGATIIGGGKAEDILKASIPTELDNVAFNDVAKSPNQTAVDDILNQ